MRHPAVAKGIGGRLRRGRGERAEAVVELAVELLLDVHADLVAARGRPRDSAHAAVVAHGVPERRAAVRELRARNVELVVLVFVGEVKPERVLLQRTAERRIDLIVVRGLGKGDQRLDGVGPVVGLQRAALAIDKDRARERIAAVFRDAVDAQAAGLHLGRLGAGRVGDFLHARIVHVKAAELAAATQVVHAHAVNRNHQVARVRPVHPHVVLSEHVEHHRGPGNEQRARRRVADRRRNRVEHVAVRDELRRVLDDIHNR